MLNRLLLVFIFLFSCLTHAGANTLSGRVTDQSNNPLPYAPVYVKGTTKGTTTNEQGNYTLDLAPGKYTVVFQYSGFLRKEEDIDLSTGNQKLDVSLASSSTQLKTVTISGGEDPAYDIIRHAIKKRKYYRDQVDAYSCDVYIKGLQRVTSHPKKIMGLDVNIDDQIDSASGIVYLSESVSKFNFKQPDKIKEEMISSKVSGDNKAFSYNRASDMLFNFYDNLINIDDLSERGFISPIAGDAMFFYKYHLVGTYMENDSLINKIEVIPKRTTDPCFRGYIYIMQNSWRIYSTELILTKDAQIDFVDTLLINQTFVPVEGDVWMVFMNKFVFNFGFMGIKGNGIYVGVNRDYNLHPDFPKKFFGNEQMHVDDDANKKDSVYWTGTRPIPLTDEEEADYRRRDSLMRLRNSKPYLDSLDRINNRPKVMDIVFSGYTFERRYNHFSVGVSPLVRALSYNTVQGVRTAMDVNIFKTWENNRWLSISPSVSYGFADQRWYSDFDASYLYKPVRFARIYCSGGTTTQQFSNRDPVPVFFNSAYTLLEKQNYLKLYAKNYGTVGWHGEIVNGFIMDINAEYAERSPLYNTSFYSWVNYPERHFTSNNPVDPENNSAGFFLHKALTVDVQALIRFKQKYYTRPNEKIILGSKYPTFGIQYRKGIPGVFGSSTDYDFLKLSVRDEINLKLFGKFYYYFAGGKFLDKTNLPFMDDYHFYGNRMIWSTFQRQSFQLLDYYKYSADSWFLEAHAEQHFGGFILNKIPLIKRLKMTEIVGLNWFVTPTVPSYYEIYFGADKLGVFRIDFALGYMQNAKVSAGLRVGIRFF